MNIENAFQQNLDSLHFYGPEILVSLTIILLIGVSVLAPKGKKRPISVTFAFIGLTGALLSLFQLIQVSPTQTIFHDLIANDPVSLIFKLIFLGTTVLVSLMVMDSDGIPGKRSPEFVFLLLSIYLGMSFLGSGLHLLILYLGLELVSLPSYVLAGYNMRDRNSSEAGIKYLIYGAVSGGSFLFGASLLYGITGAFTVGAIGSALAGVEQFYPVVIALLLMLVGLGYKCSFFPMHMWVPDVYQGAPAAVGGFLSTAPKAAGFAVLLRLSYEWVPALQGNTNFALGLAIPAFFFFISLITMTVGNLSAIAQNNVKRLLGYSTVAHVGYILMGYTLVGTQWMDEGFSAIVFYLIIYTVTNLGAFFVIVALKRPWLDDLNGLVTRAPVTAIAMAIFLFSLTGIPPLVGYAGKFYLFAALIQSGMTLMFVLALAGVVNSVVSFVYYGNVLKHIFLHEPDSDKPINVSPLSRILLVLLAVSVVGLGVLWSPVVSFTQQMVAFI